MKPQAGSPEVAVSRPVKIRIPTINVSSPLTVVGLQADGTLEVPQPGPDYDKAAWFDGSPAPGEIGPAVIEGHVDGAVNGPSVFYRLGELKPDDKLVVDSRDGTVIRFEVYAVRLFAKSNFPTLKVYGNTNGSELRLITCGGPFDPNRAEGGYTDNVVVFARRL
ncbi:MAG: class F sortase [Actinomycetia bacterium]|nr:class F sortase [Actinomycetes bacterium]